MPSANNLLSVAKQYAYVAQKTPSLELSASGKRHTVLSMQGDSEDSLCGDTEEL